jgi:5-formyltetrahydrofolate cyclo-ligase
MLPVDNDGPWGRYASPPCFLHELDPCNTGLQISPPAEGVLAWRKGERERLVRERQAITSSQRLAWDKAIISALEQVIGYVNGLVIGAYWPFRGEPDLRPFLADLVSRGARTALPVVVAKRQPLVLRAWKDGERLDRGVWNIPIPTEGEPVAPDIIIAPLVGFDRTRCRLGYGGGFFNRALAAFPGIPGTIGVGYSRAELPTIHPLADDIRMDAIVTEGSVITVSESVCLSKYIAARPVDAAWSALPRTAA